MEEEIQGEERNLEEEIEGEESYIGEGNRRRREVYWRRKKSQKRGILEEEIE